jgi:hypothetical protein
MRMRIYRLSQAEFRAWRDHDTRTELTKRIFAEHGLSQIRTPSGRVLGTARQTNERVPIEQTKLRGAHHAVRPGECMCREWQKPAGREAEHHPICVNKSAWESQQLHDPDAPRDRVVVSATTAHEPEPADSTTPTEPPPPPDFSSLAGPSPPVASAAAPAVPAIPEPQRCACHVWAGGVTGHHHPLCQFRGAWERKHGIAGPQLIDLETGEVAREASPEEAAASKQKEPEDGVGAIELSDGKLYYVRAG